MQTSLVLMRCWSSNCCNGSGDHYCGGYDVLYQGCNLVSGVYEGVIGGGYQLMRGINIVIWKVIE